MTYKFYGGVHPPTFKTLTLDRPIKMVYIPKKVTIPLSQHTGSPAEPVVAAGDSVKVGAVIAKATGYISSPVHATISGKVTKIAYSPTPTQDRILSVSIESFDKSSGFDPERSRRIESQGTEEDQEFKTVKRSNPESLSREELPDIIKDAGIVGLGGAAFPAHVKLSPPKEKRIDSVILNGAECEPYLTCDHRLMLEKSKEILRGLEIIAKILDVKNAYIAIEDNKLSAIYAMAREASAFSSQVSAVSLKVIKLKTKYPQGAEKQVIKSVLNRTVPAGGLPMDVGCVVHNVGTALAIYEAVYLGKPLIERCITITGSCVKEPMNLWVRIGTLLSDLRDHIGGLKNEPKKIVVGGPMMGIAQYTMDVPVVKGTSGILFLSEEDMDRDEESVCIRCGRCIEVCPMGLAPTTLMYHVKKDMFKEAKELGIQHCYECGSCAYICPAKIPLLDYMKFGKSMIHPAKVPVQKGI